MKKLLLFAALIFSFVIQAQVPYEPGQKVLLHQCYTFGGQTWKAVKAQAKGTYSPRANSYWVLSPDCVYEPPVTLDSLHKQSKELQKKLTMLGQLNELLNQRLSILEKERVLLIDHTGSPWLYRKDDATVIAKSIIIEGYYPTESDSTTIFRKTQ